MPDSGIIIVETTYDGKCLESKVLCPGAVMPASSNEAIDSKSSWSQANQSPF